MPKRIKPLSEVLDGIDTGTTLNMEAVMTYDKDIYICRNKESENHRKQMSHYDSCDKYNGLDRGNFQCWACYKGKKVNLKISEATK